MSNYKKTVRTRKDGTKVNYIILKEGVKLTPTEEQVVGMYMSQGYTIEVVNPNKDTSKNLKFDELFYYIDNKETNEVKEKLNELLKVDYKTLTKKDFIKLKAKYRTAKYGTADGKTKEEKAQATKQFNELQKEIKKVYKNK